MEHNSARQAKGRRAPTAFPSKLSSPLILHFKHQLLCHISNTAKNNFFSMKRLHVNPNKFIIVTLTGFTKVLFIQKKDILLYFQEAHTD